MDGRAPGVTGEAEQPPRAAPAVPSPGRLLVLAVLLVGLIVGGCLVITGGGDPADTTLPSRPTSTLPLGDLSITGIESLSGIDVPEGAADYLSARLDGDRQLDVTFTVTPEQLAGFISSSGLPPVTEGNRVILHSSPLWKLNPGTPISGVADIRDATNRAVEVTPEGDRLRVRITLQAI